MVAVATAVPVGPMLTQVQAREIDAQGEEAVVFVLLEMARQLSLRAAAAAATGHDSPATPSGMKPPYAKPAASARQKNPGCKPGHPGSRRAVPDRIDAYETHRAKVCPLCGGPLCRCAETRTRDIEDIPLIQPVVTEHTIHRDWCPACAKKVEPPVSAALPGSMLGNRLLVLTAWLHDALGNTLSQIGEVFNFHLQMQISAGGLIQMWQRLVEILYPWYEQIQQAALNSAVLHADGPP